MHQRILYLTTGSVCHSPRKSNICENVSVIQCSFLLLLLVLVVMLMLVQLLNLMVSNRVKRITNIWVRRKNFAYFKWNFAISKNINKTQCILMRIALMWKLRKTSRKYEWYFQYRNDCGCIFIRIFLIVVHLQEYELFRTEMNIKENPV